jgi:ribonuclease HI
MPCVVTVINNNAYITDALMKGWVYRWRARGWVNSEGKPTPHADLWEELISLCSLHQILFEWRHYDPADREYVRCNLLAHQAALAVTGSCANLLRKHPADLGEISL